VITEIISKSPPVYRLVVARSTLIMGKVLKTSYSSFPSYHRKTYRS